MPRLAYRPECSAPRAHPPTAAAAAIDTYIRSEARRLLAETAALDTMPGRDLCKVRWLYYRGDENYGLGNVLYDVASAAALAIVLNRTLVYGRNAADRKFGSLLSWPGTLTMEQADALRSRTHCGNGPLATQRRVHLAPDKCTFHRTWRRERAGHVRCFKRLLGVNWLAERTPLMELSKVHAFSGLQTLLKSAHAPVRERIAALTGGCLRSGERPNVHGALLATLMRPVPAVRHAVKWALAQQQAQQRQLLHQHYGVPWNSLHPWTPPQIALHVRAMADHRARNLTASEQANQMHNALQCVRREAASAAAAGAEGAPSSPPPTVLSAVVVSSSPELRAQLVRRIVNRARRAREARKAGAASAAASSAAAAEPPILPLVFDWREYAQRAPRPMVAALAASESAAATFCAGVNQSNSFRCNRTAHLRDWGPEPHWVAVVELLLVSTVSHVVVGAGYPYFKVCNTFAQIGAALADAQPDWLCALTPQRRRSKRRGGKLQQAQAQAQQRRGSGRLLSQQPSQQQACPADGGPRGVQLVCASHAFSTDWGSSMWKALNVTTRRGGDYVLECGAPTCLPTPLHPELWEGLKGEATCPASGDTMPPDNLLFGAPIRQLGHQH